MQYEIPSIKVEILELENVICTSLGGGTLNPIPGGDSDEDFGQFGKEKDYEGEGNIKKIISDDGE